MAEVKKKWVCTQRRHWIPEDMPGRSRRRWRPGDIYDGTATPPDGHFKEIDSEELKEARMAQERNEYMQPQSLQEQQILDMSTKKDVIRWLVKNYEGEAVERGVDDKMTREELNLVAFELVRKNQ